MIYLSDYGVHHAAIPIGSWEPLANFDESTFKIFIQTRALGFSNSKNIFTTIRKNKTNDTKNTKGKILLKMKILEL